MWMASCALEPGACQGAVHKYLNLVLFGVYVGVIFSKRLGVSLGGPTG